MSDEQIQSPAPTETPKPRAPLIDLRAAHYARLLFGKGSVAWHENDHGNYMHIVYPPEGKKFTQADLDACNAVLFNECGATNLDQPLGLFSGDYMAFIITPDDMGWLEEYGIKPNAAGKNLCQPDMTSIACDTVENDPMAVLQENLRMTALNHDSWGPGKKHAFLKGERRECELILPTPFLEQLDARLPNLHGNKFERKELIRDALTQLLPRIPVTVNSFDGEHGSLFTLSVTPEYYGALENAIMAAKQVPATNVTSIEVARRLKEGQSRA